MSDENDSWLGGIGICVEKFFSSDPQEGGSSQAPPVAVASKPSPANGGYTPAPANSSSDSNQSGPNPSPPTPDPQSSSNGYGPGVKEQYDRGYQHGLGGSEPQPGPLINKTLAAYEDGYAKGSRERQPPEEKPQPKQDELCIQVIYVQKGLRPRFEEDTAKHVGETMLHVTELGMLAFDIYKLATATSRAIATAAAIGVGAELVVAAGLFVIIAPNHPVELPLCRALCPECEERLQKSGDPSTQCTLPHRHCDEHRCKNHHSWVG